MPESKVQSYNDPLGGNDSTIGSQIRTDKYKKSAIIALTKEQYFGQLADVTKMPKHMGKTIRMYEYIPLLSDENANDQGIDAAGQATSKAVTVTIGVPNDSGTVVYSYHFQGTAATTAAAKAEAEKLATTWLMEQGLFDTDYATTVAAIVGATPAYTVTDNSAEDLPAFGNLYGSSKDVGTIASKMPTLTEHGGRVNRVGHKRKELSGTIHKFGFFDEYTKESMDFDTDEQKEMHVNREMTRAANEIVEDALQIDLLNAAGVIRYGGDATNTSSINANNGGIISEVSYEDLMRLNIDLDNNRTPKNTTMITGSRMVDTKTINGARVMFIGSELIPTMKSMVDTFGNPAFVSVEKYAHAGNILRGEIGTVDQFRLVVVPEMMHWMGAGASVVDNLGYRETGGKFDVFPMLVVGDKSFTNIGFQTDGKSVKFKVKHVKPESDTSYGFHDPYGEKGFMSIKWYYGFLAFRPERIALIKTVAKW